MKAAGQEDRDREIARRVGSGEPLADVARAFGITTTWARAIARREGKGSDTEQVVGTLCRAVYALICGEEPSHVDRLAIAYRAEYGQPVVGAEWNRAIEAALDVVSGFDAGRRVYSAIEKLKK